MADLLVGMSNCPSGALRLEVGKSDLQHMVNGDVDLTIERNGPYRVKNVALDAEFNGAGASQTKFVLCRCGHTKNKPLHRDEGWTAVAKVFIDKGVSGGLIDRPGMQDMLSFLAGFKEDDSHVVIIDDISRLARGLEAHIQLRTAIGGAGGKLESPSIEFGEDSDSILVENLLASVAQHQRQKNGEQTLNRMRARCQNGYWVFNAPFGYAYKKTLGHGKLLVRDEPIASIIAEALEGYASGCFESPSEVKRFLEAQPAYPKNKKGEIHPSQITTLLQKPIYAGYITHEKWGLHLLSAKHEPLISFATWQKNQERRKARPNDPGHAKAPIRKDTRPDFPLRGFVTCSDCARPMTAAWSKGRRAHYGYYFCQTKDCSEFRKNIRRETLEGDFETLLRQMRPSESLFEIGYDMLKEIWEDKRQKVSSAKSDLKAELAKIETKAEQVMTRLLAADSAALINAYEGEIKRLDVRKVLMAEKTANCERELPSFERTYRTACEFLANPWKLWASRCIKDRRTLLRLAFAGRIPYHREKGYRTAIPALPFKVLAGFADPKSVMVPHR